MDFLQKPVYKTKIAAHTESMNTKKVKEKIVQDIAKKFEITVNEAFVLYKDAWFHFKKK